MRCDQLNSNDLLLSLLLHSLKLVFTIANIQLLIHTKYLERKNSQLVGEIKDIYIDLFFEEGFPRILLLIAIFTCVIFTLPFIDPLKDITDGELFKL